VHTDTLTRGQVVEAVEAFLRAQGVEAQAVTCEGTGE
jgi:hypothetical protein